VAMAEPVVTAGPMVPPAMVARTAGPERSPLSRT
jgi:hypothetical protein